jgi:hypothetical protein
MGIGILQPRDGSHTPVTGTKLFDEVSSLGTDEEAVGLKRHPKHHDIILQPQPSDDPDDPLNWSRLRKEVCGALTREPAGGIAFIDHNSFSSRASSYAPPLWGLSGRFSSVSPQRSASQYTNLYPATSRTAQLVSENTSIADRVG